MVILYLILGILTLVSGWFILYHVPLLKPAKDESADGQKLSIIIPARNEAHNLPILLTSITKQSMQPVEVIVADDGSEDETAEVASAFGAKVVQWADKDSDWVGKSAGCYAGAHAAQGEWLLFLDADTFLPERDSLARIVQTFQQQKAEGILSLQPYHVIQQPYENLSSVFNILVLAGMNRFSFLQDKLEAGGAFGPSLLCSKTTYFEIGGHKRVKASIMENVTLGKVFLEEDEPVQLYGGKGTLHFRMYPEGFASVGAGWAKSFASGSTSTHPFILIATSLWITGAFVSFFYLIFALWSGEVIPILVAIIGYFAYFVQFCKMAKKAGHFNGFALFFYPVWFLYFVSVFLVSAIQTFLVGSVSWKGRKMNV